MYNEGVESTFTHNGKLYYIDDLLTIARCSKSELIKVNELSWILEYTCTNAERINNADLSVPIIIVSTEQWGLVVLDGVHRLSLAIKNNIDCIQCKLINEKQFNNLSCIS